MENFFLISSSSMSFFPDNTRAVFKNILPKDYNVENNVMFLNLDSVVFSNSYKKYVAIQNDTPDIMCRFQNTYDVFQLPSLSTVKELFNELISFFIICAQKRDIAPADYFNASYHMNRITLTLNHGDILISDRLKDLLMFQNNIFLRKKDVKSGLFYNILRSRNDASFTYTSYQAIQLNEDDLSYVNIFCDEVDAYEGGSKIISKIPIKNKILNDFSNILPQYFRIDISELKELKIAFLQPNNVRVFFDDSSPNILKFNLKKNLPNMDFFYVNVTSKATNSYPQNNCSEFYFELMKDYTLNGDWEVCVLNTYIPGPQGFLYLNDTIYDFDGKVQYFGVCRINENAENERNFFKFPLTKFRRRQLYLYMEQNLSNFIETYVDQNEQIIIKQRTDLKTEGENLLIFVSRDMYQLLNAYFSLPYLTEDSATESALTEFQSFKKKLTDEKIPDESFVAIYLTPDYLNFWKKSRNIFHIPPKIFYDDEQTDLMMEMMVLNSGWELATKSANFISRHEFRLLKYLEMLNVAEYREFTPSYFFIYTDFVQETAMGDRCVNFIKLVPYKNGMRGLPGGLFTFNTEEYFNVNKSYLRTLNFKLKTHSGDTYQFFPRDAEIQILLKFRKKKN